MTGEKPLLTQPRVRHLAIAFVAALVIGVFGLVEPLNGLIWAVQSRALQHRASGEIVFIGADPDIADPANAGARAELADTIDRLYGRPGASEFSLTSISSHRAPLVKTRGSTVQPG